MEKNECFLCFFSKLKTHEQDRLIVEMNKTPQKSHEVCEECYEKVLEIEKYEKFLE